MKKLKTKSLKEHSNQNDTTTIVKDYIEIFYYSVIQNNRENQNQPAKLQEL